MSAHDNSGPAFPLFAPSFTTNMRVTDKGPDAPAEVISDETSPEVHYGVSRREWFAAHAPAEVPDWFERSLGPLPQIATFEEAAAAQPGYSDLPDSERVELASWMRKDAKELSRDGLYIIGKAACELMAAQQQAREHERTRRDAERFFNWRRFYADQMLRTLAE